MTAANFVLPDLRILTRANYVGNYSGLDDPTICPKQDHFQAYPHHVDYHYNSRGFRDQEWPDTFEELQNATWCIGDSFTAGLGVPIEHTWPARLAQHVGRTINVSMDGASNNWIARQAEEILKTGCPTRMVIHWSYSHRRELPLKPLLDGIWQEFYNNVRGNDWPDCVSSDNLDQLPVAVRTQLEQQERFAYWSRDYDLDTMRKLHQANTTVEQDLLNTQHCIDQVCKYSNTTIVHSFIPKWHSESAALEFYSMLRIPEFAQLDWARDAHHYDIKTADYFVAQVLEILNLPA